MMSVCTDCVTQSCKIYLPPLPGCKHGRFACCVYVPREKRGIMKCHDEPSDECGVGEVSECPVLHSTFTEYGHKFYCALRGGRKGFPDTCPYAPILKGLMEAEEVGDYKFMPHDPIYPDNWDLFEFWIRRQ